MMKPEKLVAKPASSPNLRYIDVRFTNTPHIWTSDKYNDSDVWVVFFNFGTCDLINVGNLNKSFVRAVR